MLRRCKKPTASLSNSEDEVQTSDLLTKEAFVADLSKFYDAYHDTIISEEEQPSTRGFWSTVGDVLDVAGADIAGAGAKAVQVVAAGIGAATGGTGYAVTTIVAAGIAGAGASVGAGRALRALPSNPMDPCYSHLSIKYPEKHAEFEKAGKVHNDFLSELSSTSLRTNLPEHSKTEEELLNNEEFMAKSHLISKIISEKINSEGGIGEVLDALNKESLITDKQHLVYDYFFDIYNDARKMVHIEDIVNFYINTIASTEYLSEEDKAILISSFSVASQSPSFWLQNDSKD